MLGPQKGKLVPCARKPKTHGHHPEAEECPACPPLKAYVPRAYAADSPCYDPFGYLLDLD